MTDFNFFIPRALAVFDFVKLPEQQSASTDPYIPNTDYFTERELLINRIVNYAFIAIAIGIFLAIIRSAYLMVSSQGDVAQFEKGKKGLIWSVTGLAVIILARFAMGVVLDWATNNPAP